MRDPFPVWLVYLRFCWCLGSMVNLSVGLAFPCMRSGSSSGGVKCPVQPVSLPSALDGKRAVVVTGATKATIAEAAS